MAFDPSIIMGYRGLGELPNPLAQMAQVSQIKSGQQQQQLNQMKIEELIADRKELNDFAVKLQDQGITPRQYMEMLRSSRDPVNRKTGAEGLMRLDEQDKYGEVLKKIYPKLYEGAPAAAPMAAAPAMGAPPALPGALMPAAAAPMNALAPTFGPTPAAPVNALINQQSTPAQLEMNIAALAPFASRPGVKEQIAGFQSQLTELRKPLVAAAGSTIYGPSGQIIANVPAQPTELQRNYEYAKNQGFKGDIFDYERKLKEATRAPAQAPTPSAPVAVVDPVTGKQVYVSREDALRGRMTPAAAMESLPPKEIQKREAALPQAQQSVKTVNNTMSIIGETVDKLLANPSGLNGITGLVGGVTPAITDASRAAKADLEQLKNLAFVQGLTELRAASKTGAGVGNVSNREGDRFENLKASLDRSQSKADLEASLRKLKAQADFTAQTMQEAFDTTYAYKTAAPATAPAAGKWEVVK
jgi:hypothetical protein